MNITFLGDVPYGNGTTIPLVRFKFLFNLTQPLPADVRAGVLTRFNADAVLRNGTLVLGGAQWGVGFNVPRTLPGARRARRGRASLTHSRRPTAAPPLAAPLASALTLSTRPGSVHFQLLTDGFRDPKYTPPPGLGVLEFVAVPINEPSDFFDMGDLFFFSGSSEGLRNATESFSVPGDTPPAAGRRRHLEAIPLISTEMVGMPLNRPAFFSVLSAPRRGPPACAPARMCQRRRLDCLAPCRVLASQTTQTRSSLTTPSQE